MTEWVKLTEGYEFPRDGVVWMCNEDGEVFIARVKVGAKHKLHSIYKDLSTAGAWDDVDDWKTNVTHYQYIDKPEPPEVIE